MIQGTESLTELASELDEVAPNVESFFDHKRAADLMRRSAVVIRRLAPLEPDLEAMQSEN